MGLLDSLKIRKNSFPFRYEYHIFVKIFSDLQPIFNPHEAEKKIQKSVVEEILECSGVKLKKNEVLYGKRRIFLTE